MSALERSDSPPASGGWELADLLRARRAGLQPVDVGLPPGGRRRTKGLRREEVAQLAGISTTYYTFLEQGRNLRPSAEVLDGLGRALRLSATECRHLHELVRGGDSGSTPATGESIAPDVVDLVERLDPEPAYVTGRCWDVLAANRAARALWTDWPALPADERNMLWWTLMDPVARAVLVDWEAEASALLARFRAAAARHPEDPRFGSLVERLHAGSPEVRAWWPRHDVGAVGPGVKRIRHPELGEIELRYVVLLVADDPEQKVVAFRAASQDRAGIAALLEPAVEA
jgi:transcriptional regulator with XRE-family HTH domain